MIFRQFRFEKLGQASYLLGCARAKDGVVGDPIADLGVDFYTTSRCSSPTSRPSPGSVRESSKPFP